ncbi:CAF17-like 4Fe-4S cluster assembly/insertion protein YgfZ [Oceanisphaera avium]|uniref:Folate-binding Fe/S cluster repair protein n=1 Tax=Oceanisphaera avium TaxID=1903694 RepID=A0A1Y0CYY7_9GAMM|nr:folate-binding Fe/S cluster repair protein [Oceanisphaera avium]ART80096.1 folate-binding Fe/S cluster repair protein [Oceanisphaera avium]
MLTLSSSPTLYPLSDRGVISLTGDDRTKYLQGQVTCDVALLNSGEATLGGHCDSKGRLWGSFWLANLREELLLITNASLLERQLPELKKFAVFAKTEVVDATLQWQVYGLAGEGLSYWLDQQVTGDNLWQGGVVIPVAAEHALLVLPKDSPAPELPIGSEQAWRGLMIQAGIPELHAEHQGEYIPQMLNLQALDGISFTKGCYMGQETVARAKYRGANKKVMYILSGTASAPISVNQDLELQLGENWRRAGTVLNVYQDGEQCLITSVLNKDLEADTVFRIKGQDDSRFSLQTLPYSLTE